MRFEKSAKGRGEGASFEFNANSAGQGSLALGSVGYTSNGTAASAPRVTNRELVLRAFETSYEHVTRYIALRIGERDQAEDLASEVFVRALDKADTFKPGEKPIQAWLFRIAHNLLVDHLRKKTRTGTSVPLDEIPEIPVEDDAHASAQQEDDVKTLAQAMSVLTESERQVISMRFAGEMKPEEIGKALGKSAGAVRWLQHSGVAKLRKHLNIDLGMELAK